MKSTQLVLGLIGLLIVIGIFMFINSRKNSNQLTSVDPSNSTEEDTSETIEADKTFINKMIEHHMGAIAMAREAKEKSQRPEITQMANNIISAQEKEIEMMYKWKKDWYNDVEKVEMSTGGHGTSMMQDLGEADAQFDLRFIKAMTEHHQGALDMAEGVVESSTNDELKTFAEKIISDQSKEIDQMKEWRSMWYGN